MTLFLFVASQTSAYSVRLAASLSDQWTRRRLRHAALSSLWLSSRWEYVPELVRTLLFPLRASFLGSLRERRVSWRRSPLSHWKEEICHASVRACVSGQRLPSRGGDDHGCSRFGKAFREAFLTATNCGPQKSRSRHK